MRMPQATVPRARVLGVMGTLALALFGTACGSHDAASSKEDVSELSMVIGQAEYPPVPEGRYDATPVKTLLSDPAPKDECDQHAWVRKGDQEVGSGIFGPSTWIYRVVVVRTQTRIDIGEWTQRCLPHTDGDMVTSELDVPDLPEDTLAVQIRRADHPTQYVAAGYVRGLLVVAEVNEGKDGMSPTAQHDLVTIYQNQAKRLREH